MSTTTNCSGRPTIKCLPLLEARIVTTVVVPLQLLLLQRPPYPVAVAVLAAAVVVVFAHVICDTPPRDIWLNPLRPHRHHRLLHRVYPRPQVKVCICRVWAANIVQPLLPQYYQVSAISSNSSLSHISRNNSPVCR